MQDVLSANDSRASNSSSFLGALLAVILFSSATTKALVPGETLRVLVRVWQAPYSLAMLVFYGLIVIETALACLLWLDGRRRFYFATAVFIVGVTVSIFPQIWLGVDTGCGCGLALPRLHVIKTQWLAVTRNMILVALALTAFVRMKRASPVSSKVGNHASHC